MSVSKKKNISKSSSRQQRRRKNTKAVQQRRLRWRTFLPFIVGIAGFALIVFYVWPYLTPAPPVVHPADPAALDPAVTELIEPMIGAVEQDPRNAALRARLAMAYEANALWNEARDSYDQAVSLNAEPVWRLHHATAVRQAGDFQESLALLEALAHEAPAMPALQQRLGEALLEAGRLDEAEAAFRRLTELSPAVQGPVGIADILLQRQQPAGAIAMLEQVLEREPNYRKAAYLLGRAYALTGKEEEAEPLLARGADASTVYLADALTSQVASYAVNVTGRLDLARAYLETNQPDQAALVLENTYRHHATNTMVLNTLATAYLRTNRLDDAHRLLLRARELDQDQFFTYLNLYQWALRSADMPGALAFADEAVALAPDRDDTHLARAQALTAIGRHEEALASADEARRLDGRKAPNHGLSGEICMRLERFAEAQRHFAVATDLDPAYLPAWVGLARAYLSEAQPEEAREALERAQQLAPNHAAVRQLASELATVE